MTLVRGLPRIDGLPRIWQDGFLPLPGTPGRGSGRGVRQACTTLPASHSALLQPLSPALSPEYRGEGAATSPSFGAGWFNAAADQQLHRPQGPAFGAHAPPAPLPPDADAPRGRALRGLRAGRRKLRVGR